MEILRRTKMQGLNLHKSSRFSHCLVDWFKYISSEATSIVVGFVSKNKKSEEINGSRIAGILDLECI